MLKPLLYGNYGTLLILTTCLLLYFTDKETNTQEDWVGGPRAPN